ncbi:MAG: cysteine synthase B, partial [Acidimicrobiales bacterium]|nr:cysteine synthase B [Acidimicrobiales bacterium]
LECTRRLADECGIFVGISAGAVLAGALKVSESLDDAEQATIVLVASDAGWKYLSTGAWTADLDEAVANAGAILYF